MKTLFSKAVVMLFVTMLGSALLAGYTAKQQYDRAVEAEQYIASLEAIIEAKEAAAVLAVKLIAKKSKREKDLANELSNKISTLKEVPTDGCLDRPVPDAALDGLR